MLTDMLFPNRPRWCSSSPHSFLPATTSVLSAWCCPKLVHIFDIDPEYEIKDMYSCSLHHEKFKTSFHLCHFGSIRQTTSGRTYFLSNPSSYIVLCEDNKQSYLKHVNNSSLVCRLSALLQSTEDGITLFFSTPYFLIVCTNSDTESLVVSLALHSRVLVSYCSIIRGYGLPLSTGGMYCVKRLHSMDGIEHANIYSSSQLVSNASTSSLPRFQFLFRSKTNGNSSKTTGLLNLQLFPQH